MCLFLYFFIYQFTSLNFKKLLSINKIIIAIRGIFLHILVLYRKFSYFYLNTELFTALYNKLILPRFLRLMHTYMIQYITLVAIAHNLLN